MKIQIVASFNHIKRASTIIVPFVDSFSENAELMAVYPAPGVKQVLNRIRTKEQKNGYVYLGNGLDTAVLFWKIKNSNAATTNKDCVETLHSNKFLLTGDVVLDLTFVDNYKNIDIISRALFRGLFLAGHTVDKFKTNSEVQTNKIESVQIISVQTHDDLLEQFKREEMTAETMMSCMQLVNDPANYKKPKDLVGWVQQSASSSGYDVEIIEHQELVEQGFHALLAVNRGSEDPACCVVAKYSGGESSAPTIALVGKGVLFDTGGLSIKPSRNMHYMKSDMGGAAAVLGAIEIVAKLKLPVNLVAVVPCTDNSVDKKSIKPGDVIGSLKGSTIEVIDTDAEGRLILADGLHYAINKLKAKYVVDLATLTGSVVQTLGIAAAGLMTNNEFMARTLEEAGQRSGDRVWRLPLWDDYRLWMKSDIADIRNLSTKPVSGAITAGIFLEHFTEGHEHWAHLDIAGMAFGPSPFSVGYSASGYGILLLLSWIENLR